MLSIFTILFIIYKKSDKKEFIHESIYYHSKNISHSKPKYKYLENYVMIANGTSYQNSPSAISIPIAHYDVEYHCNSCSKIFNSKLKMNINLKDNQNKFKIEYKE